MVGFCDHGKETLGSVEGEKFISLIERLVASQERLWLMLLATNSRKLR
jgi:hypothetical protein